MAIYSTFFLSEPAQLPEGFPGWKLPLETPVTQKTTNPFSGEEITVTTRVPEWVDFEPDNIEMPEVQVVAIEGDYQAYLEGRIPPFIRSQPHWCGKNLTSVELEPLAETVIGREDVEFDSPLYAHPSLGCGLEQLPEEFVMILQTADDSTLHSIAEQWAEFMSTPDFTHSVSGERIQDNWSVDDALSLLEPIAELVRQAKQDQSLYLLIEG